MSCARLWFHGFAQGHSQGSKVSIRDLWGHLLYTVTFLVFRSALILQVTSRGNKSRSSSIMSRIRSCRYELFAPVFRLASVLQITRTGMKSRLSSIMGKIRLFSKELSALFYFCIRVYGNFTDVYIQRYLTNLDKI